MTELSTRTHPIFKGTTTINSVNLGITTRCTMKCPNCSIGIPALQQAKKDRDAPIAELARAGAIMTSMGRFPLRRVHLTGGEPTFHRYFSYIAEHVRNWFLGTEFITIETNGTLYKRYKDVLKEFFDLVFITHYVKDKIYPDNPDNTEIIAEAKEFLGDKLVIEAPVEHTQAHHKGLIHLGTRTDKIDPELDACGKFHYPGLACAYYNNRIYPCCVTVGIDPALSIPLSQNWREEIVKVDKGCVTCCFRGT